MKRLVLLIAILVALPGGLVAEATAPSTSDRAVDADEPPLYPTPLTAVSWDASALAPPSAPIGLTNPDGPAWMGFVAGHCTRYVASRRKIVFRGDAKHWPKNALKAGYRLADTPIAGAVVVTNESWYGHVAYVERVNDDGTFFVSEMNVKGRFKISTRTLALGDRRIVTFIL